MRDDGLWVSREKSSNAGPDLAVSETGLTTKNAFVEAMWVTKRALETG